MQLSPKHEEAIEIQRRAELIEDEWLLLQDDTTRVNELSKRLYEHLRAAMLVSDELIKLRASLEYRLIAKALGALQTAYQLMRSLVIVSGGFKTAFKSDI